MLKRKLQARSENPFYGKDALKSLYELGQGNKVTPSVLTKAWNQCKNSDILRQGFFCVVFSFGDIPNRQHHIFSETKMVGGGEGSRESFEVFLKWMLADDSLHNYYYAFLESDVIRQYTSVWNVMQSGVRTVKGKSKITKVYDMLAHVDLDRQAEYLAKVIRTAPPAELVSVSKYLSRIRFTRKRKSGKYSSVQPETAKLMNLKKDFYIKLSDAMSWPYQIHANGSVTFEGMNKWKKEHNGANISVMFSTGKVKNLNTENFINWLEILPAGSRQRVFAIINKKTEKWTLADGTTAQEAYAQWQASKEVAQSKVRELKEMKRNAGGELSEELEAQLTEATQAAKVNTGGETLFSLFEKALLSQLSEKEFNINADQMLEKTDLRVDVAVSVDISASMRTRHSKYPCSRMTIAHLITTMLMLKNPSEDLDNLLMSFEAKANIFTDQRNTGAISKNRFMGSKAVEVDGLIDKTFNFTDNFNRIAALVHGSGGSTNIEAVADAIVSWVREPSDPIDQQLRKEIVARYPSFLFVSDNEFNSRWTQLQSVSNAMMTLRNIGWDGIFILWDVDIDLQRGSNRFTGMENVVYLAGCNASSLTMIFEKMHDSEIIDVYTPLHGVWRSDRYAPVRDAVLIAEQGVKNVVETI